MDKRYSVPGEPFRSGEIVTVEALNWLLDQVVRNRVATGQGSGLAMVRGPGGTTLRVVGKSSSAGRFFLYPTGGIPAMTTAGSVRTLGKATCDLLKADSDGKLTADGTGDVWNSMPYIVGAASVGKVGQAKSIDGLLVADVEPCS